MGRTESHHTSFGGAWGPPPLSRPIPLAWCPRAEPRAAALDSRESTVRPGRGPSYFGSLKWNRKPGDRRSP